MSSSNPGGENRTPRDGNARGNEKQRSGGKRGDGDRTMPRRGGKAQREGAARTGKPGAKAPRGGAPKRERTPRPEPELLRLQVFLARAGVASRRASEELITAGRVTVNGKKVTELGSKVDPAKDRVVVNGRVVQMERPLWIAVNKPAGYVTTRDDPQGRRTVYDLIPRELHHLFHVGRLDLDSEGLILLTNDGETANRLLHPRYGTTKEYLADVEGVPTPSVYARLLDGVRLEDGVAHAVEAEPLFPVGRNATRIRIVLEEGRNREVRRMLDAVGHPVRELLRRRFGPIDLRALPRGRWRYLIPPEIRALKAQGRADDTPSP
jgi:23S rRNA pseudouridine2605 synthase